MMLMTQHDANNLNISVKHLTFWSNPFKKSLEEGYYIVGG